MSAEAVTLPRDWSRTNDEEGHIDYTLIWRVNTTNVLDGPDTAHTAAGLPLPGASLNYGNTVNTYARYNRKGGAKLVKADGSRKLWDVTTVFSTRPLRRCSTGSFENPLLEPHKVRGGSVKIPTELIKDKDGDPILNSAEERFRGPTCQDVIVRPTIELEMNVSWVSLSFLYQYVEAVNDATWWGCAARVIKCTDFTWEQMLWGVCSEYFHVAFSFELKEDTWDLYLLDEGTRVKIPDTDPPEYWKYKDGREENAQVLLDGSGNALDPGDDPVYRHFRAKQELDFSAVGWPATLL